MRSQTDPTLLSRFQRSSDEADALAAIQWNVLLLQTSVGTDGDPGLDGAILQSQGGRDKGGGGSEFRGPTASQHKAPSLALELKVMNDPRRSSAPNGSALWIPLHHVGMKTSIERDRVSIASKSSELSRNPSRERTTQGSSLAGVERGIESQAGGDDPLPLLEVMRASECLSSRVEAMGIDPGLEEVVDLGIVAIDLRVEKELHTVQRNLALVVDSPTQRSLEHAAVRGQSACDLHSVRRCR